MLKNKSINFGCHKIPERCFTFRNKTMPFCSRCFGCGIGHIISIILFILGRLPSFELSTLLIIPLAIDWTLQKYFGIMSNNCRRLITGIMGGLGVGLMIWKIVWFLIMSFY